MANEWRTEVVFPSRGVMVEYRWCPRTCTGAQMRVTSLAHGTETSSCDVCGARS